MARLPLQLRFATPQWSKQWMIFMNSFLDSAALAVIDLSKPIAGLDPSLCRPVIFRGFHLYDEGECWLHFVIIPSNHSYSVYWTRQYCLFYSLHLSQSTGLNICSYFGALSSFLLLSDSYCFPSYL